MKTPIAVIILVTVVVAVALFASGCSHRHPVTYRELSGQVVEPPGGYQAYLP